MGNWAQCDFWAWTNLLQEGFRWTLALRNGFVRTSFFACFGRRYRRSKTQAGKIVD